MKAGIVLALGVGYVAGARAGRGRYRQIVSASQRVADVLERYAGGGSGDGDRAEPARDAAEPQPDGTWRNVVRAWASDDVLTDGDEGRSETDGAERFDDEDRRPSVGAGGAFDEFDRLIASSMHGGPSRGE